MRPFLKWAGGKRQLLRELKKHVPKTYGTYYEPFVGAGAVLFHLRPERAVINDVNGDLMNAYRVVKEHIDELLAALSLHRNDREYFYEVRALDRTTGFTDLNCIERASRLIYLNKTCYNGLFRVNSQGQFNVPFGRYKNPKIVNEHVLRHVHQYLATNDVTIVNQDFADALETATRGDFVYLDPPYDPVSDTAAFTGYFVNGFGKREQIRLKDTVDELTRRGCLVLLSNASTPFIRELYQGYDIHTLSASRAINSNASRRGKIDEVLVKNYE